MNNKQNKVYSYTKGYQKENNFIELATYMGRVTILPDFGGSGRVSTSDFLVFLLIISWYLNRYESSNTAFGLIDFLRYLIYNY